jgi:hypothetical protein
MQWKIETIMTYSFVSKVILASDFIIASKTQASVEILAN